MNNQLNIPAKIKIGYQNRQDTYTGKLAYITYYDHKNTLRKETSWEGWRDKKIAPTDYDNTPTEGFVLNKNGGGNRHHYSWNPRNEFIRVYDPRGFEFEISLSNLLFILTETDCTRGKGLEGKFVYAWHQKDLILLPTTSTAYKNSTNYTNLQTQKISTKELKQGATYTTKKQQDQTYLGKYNYHYIVTHTLTDPDKTNGTGTDKRFVFWNHTTQTLTTTNNINHLATLKTDTTHPEYPTYVTKYTQTENATPITKLHLKPPTKPLGPYDTWYYEETPGTIIECITRRKHPNTIQSEIQCIETINKYILKDGIIHKYPHYRILIPPNTSYNHHIPHHQQKAEWRQPTNHTKLYATNENGTEFEIHYHTLEKY